MGGFEDGFPYGDSGETKKVGTFKGVDVIVSPDIPPNQVLFVNDHNMVVGKIVNVKASRWSKFKFWVRSLVR